MSPASTTSPAGRTSAAKRGASSLQRPGEDVGEQHVDGRRQRRGGRVHLHPRARGRCAAAFSAVASSACGSMSKQCTARAPSFSGGEREDARAAAVVDDLRPPGPMASSHRGTAPWSGACRCRRPGPGRPHDDRVGVARRARAAGTPTAAARSASGMEVLEPLALPGAIGDAARRGCAGGSAPSARRGLRPAGSACVPGANRRCRRVAGQSGVSPGRGSSTGCVAGVARG